MKIDVKLNKKEFETYSKICFKIWGCVPVDYNWAIRTSIYQKALEDVEKV